MKVCTRCHAQREESYFYTRTNGRLAAECKRCTIERSAASRLAKLDYWKEYDRINGRKKRELIKEAVFAKYGGMRCVCCGETEPLFLTLDHINNNGAEERKRLFGRQTAAGYVTYRYLFANNFPPGYQVLCANCQHGKRMNKGVCPHLRKE